MRAGEHLFARGGIDGTSIREINRLAGQRNPSAVHYHFGSKYGLVRAILVRHQEVVEVEVSRRLDELDVCDGGASVRDLIEAMARPLAGELETPAGRDFLRIVPPYITRLDANIRLGVTRPITNQSARLLRLLESRLEHMSEAAKRERLVAYTLVLTTILAERARQLEEGQPASLDADQFVTHLLDVTEAVVTGPSHLPESPEDRS